MKGVKKKKRKKNYPAVFSERHKKCIEAKEILQLRKYRTFIHAKT